MNPELESSCLHTPRRICSNAVCSFLFCPGRSGSHSIRDDKLLAGEQARDKRGRLSADVVDEVVNQAMSSDCMSKEALFQPSTSSCKHSNIDKRLHAMQRVEEATVITSELEEYDGSQFTDHLSIRSTPCPSTCDTSVQNAWMDEVFSIYSQLPTEQETTRDLVKSYETPLPQHMLKGRSASHMKGWLDELYNYTLESQVEDKVFVGGAEEHSPENPCPICSKPQGDPRFQHYLRCKYAHEEQARMESFIQHDTEREGWGTQRQPTLSRR